jgi:hypothetical protein
MSSSARLIQQEDLPASLWLREERVLLLPPALVTSWTTLLDRHGLRTRAEQPPSERGPTGGLSPEACDDHFARRFTGSAARVQLAVLDPHLHLPEIADAFTVVFAGGRVAMADLPCGAGAASLAILTTLAELRSAGLIPREPLDVVLIGGEIAERARCHAADGLAVVRPLLEQQAIFVSETIMHWDVCDSLSNTDLIQQLTIRSQGCGARALVLANFSDFLQREDKWPRAKPQFEELFRHSRDKRSSVVWIEPAMNNALPETGGLFSRLGIWLAELRSRFVHIFPTQADPNVVARSQAEVSDPLNPAFRFPVTLAVKRFDLYRN